MSSGAPETGASVPGNGTGAGADGAVAARIDLVRGVDGLTPPAPDGLLRPISPARVPGSRRQRHEEARAARAGEPAATNGGAGGIDAGQATSPVRADDGSADVDLLAHGSGAANGATAGPDPGDDGPDPLDWAELKLPPVQGEDDDLSPYEGLPAEPVGHHEGPEAETASAPVAIGAESGDEANGLVAHDIPVMLEEEPAHEHGATDEPITVASADDGRAAAAAAPPMAESPPEDQDPPAADAAAEAVVISPAPPDPSPFGPKPIATPAADVDRTVASAPPQPPATFALPASAPPATAPTLPNEVAPEPDSSEPNPAGPELLPAATAAADVPPPPADASPSAPARPPTPPQPPPASVTPRAETPAPPQPPPTAFAPPAGQATPLPPPPTASAPPPPSYDGPIAPPPAYEPVAFDPGTPPPPPPPPPLASVDEPGLDGADEPDSDPGDDLQPYGAETTDDLDLDLDQESDDHLADYADEAYDDETEDETDDGFVPPAATLELRQIAGLTAGIDLELDRAGHEFAEGDQSVAFTITVDDKDRAVLVPGTMSVKLDTQPVTQPTLIGWGALDVGSARFVVRPRRSFPQADEWLAQREAFDRPELEIEVPPTLGLQVAAPVEPDRGRRRFGRRRAGDSDPPAETLNAESWEFIDRIRAARADLADRERYLHPDPAELVVRTRSRAPILGIRPPGHPLFAKVGVIVADMPWMPNFDDIRAIPDTLGPYLQPLMSLPSIPIAADLLVGPLGIVGSRAAAAACARHIILSLHALSTPDLRVHIAASPERAPVWDWAYDLAVHDEIDLDHGFPVVVVDGIENFGRYGVTHADAIEHRVGVVILTDSIDDLPNYCGSVLQVDRSGSALLTNHLGHVIAGTPVGVANDFALHLADDLNTLYRQRR